VDAVENTVELLGANGNSFSFPFSPPFPSRKRTVTVFIFTLTIICPPPPLFPSFLLSLFLPNPPSSSADKTGTNPVRKNPLPPPPPLSLFFSPDRSLARAAYRNTFSDLSNSSVPFFFFFLLALLRERHRQWQPAQEQLKQFSSLLLLFFFFSPLRHPSIPNGHVSAEH